MTKSRFQPFDEQISWTKVSTLKAIADNASGGVWQRCWQPVQEITATEMNPLGSFIEAKFSNDEWGSKRLQRPCSELV